MMVVMDDDRCEISFTGEIAIFLLELSCSLGFEVSCHIKYPFRLRRKLLKTILCDKVALIRNHALNDAKLLIYATRATAVILSLAVSSHGNLRLMDKNEQMSSHDVTHSLALEDVMS